MNKFTDPSPRRFRIMTIIIMYIFVALLLIGYNNFGLSGRIINDYSDRGAYADRGEWILKGLVPYRDVPNEYPQITVAIFGLITWLTVPIMPPEFSFHMIYSAVWAGIMIVVFLLVVWQIYNMLPSGKKKYAWLMFLPSALYFSVNRFDILPVYLGLLSLAALQRSRFIRAVIFLALGVFTKWYLVLILPFFLLYELNKTHRLPWRSVLTFVGISLAILLPTLIMGGWYALWQPYGFHLSRLTDPGTLLWFVNQMMGYASQEVIKARWLTSIFTILAFCGFFQVIFVRFNSIRKVILASIVSLLIFIIMRRIFSPQWWLWVLPFLILTIDSKVDLIPIIFYDLINYCAFPLAYDYFSMTSKIFYLVSGILLVWLIVIFVRNIYKLFNREEAELM